VKRRAKKNGRKSTQSPPSRSVGAAAKPQRPPVVSWMSAKTIAPTGAELQTKNPMSHPHATACGAKKRPIASRIAAASPINRSLRAGAPATIASRPGPVALMVAPLR